MDTTMDTVTTTVTPVETSLRTSLDWLTKDAIASIIASHPEIVEILNADAKARLESVTTINGKSYTVKSAAETLVTLYKAGLRVGKAVVLPDGSRNERLMEFLLSEGNTDVNPEDANYPCLLQPADAQTFVLLDEWLGELGVNRSRGAKGIWGLATL